MTDTPRITVTGASGFMGRYVVRELINKRQNVTITSRNAATLEEFQGQAEIVEIDLKNPSADIFDKLNKPDILFHLSWDGLPHYNSLHHFEQELPNQYSFLRLMVEGGLKSMFVTGTCFEYGMQSGALSEEMSAQPENPYGFAKDVLRQKLHYLKKVKPFCLTWARLFYIYGQGQSSHSLFSQLQAAINSGKTEFNMSGGEQLRDYLSVTEVARVIVSLGLQQVDHGIINVCSGKPISVRRFVEEWLKKNKHQMTLNLGYYPYPEYEPMAFWGDSRKRDACIKLCV
jgi:nucleoside-diphosphate-sugar epimerase